MGVMSSTATLSSEAVQMAIRLAHAASPGETLATDAVCEVTAAPDLQFIAQRGGTVGDGARGGPLYEVRGGSES